MMLVSMKLKPSILVIGMKPFHLSVKYNFLVLSSSKPGI